MRVPQAGNWVAEALVRRAGDPRPAHTYVGAAGERVELSRDALLAVVRHRAGALCAAGLRPGDRVALTTGDPSQFVSAFLGAMWMGAVPVPLAAPPSVGRREAWREATAEVVAVAAPTFVCATAAESALLRDVQVLSYDSLGSPRDEAPAVGEPAAPVPGAPAYLQFSSGATDRVKAVAVAWTSLRANCAAIAEALAFDAGTDRGVTWLPLHHDMGLVGFVLAPLTAGVPVVFLPTGAFVRDPGSWLREVARSRGTISFAPNFAYALAARWAAGGGANGLDLSSLRVLGCGGEPIDPAVLRRFADVLHLARLDPAALVPAYGLAEATLAVTFARRDGPPRVDRIDPHAYRAGLATAAGDGPATNGGPNRGQGGVEVVDCGRPLPGMELAVVDAAGAPAAERTIGEIWVRGPSVAAGYLDRPQETAAAFRPDGWLRTGDLGYLADGGLHVTGRVKDLLVVRGRNVDPQRLEWLVEALPGARGGGVVAFTRTGDQTEEVVVVVECRPATTAGLADQVRAVVADRLGLAVADVVPVGPGTIPKTSSGKPRRAETRRRYLAGTISGVDA